MAHNADQLSKDPRPDEAEDNAFFPSPYSLTQYTSPKTDFAGVQHKGAYTGGRWKVLMIAAEERYIVMENGKMFSTGNHPVEMLLPLHHLMEAGFDVDVATISGYPAKLELWAVPRQDEAVLATYEMLKPKLKQPKKLSEVVADDLGADSDYLAVFIPGGHAAMVGLPVSQDVGRTLDWALANERFIISLCHGPAALLAASLGKQESPFKGYSVCVFPDALDQGPNVEMGYIPGRLQWLVADLLSKEGLTVVNDDMTGQTHQDRLLLTGDSPLASNKLGLLAADALVEAVGPGRWGQRVQHASLRLSVARSKALSTDRPSSPAPKTKIRSLEGDPTSGVGNSWSRSTQFVGSGRQLAAGLIDSVINVHVSPLSFGCIMTAARLRDGARETPSARAFRRAVSACVAGPPKHAQQSG